VRPRVTLPLGVLATSIATGALVSGQAYYATRRKDLPSVVGADASGTEGDPALPAVHVACAGDSTLTGPGLDHPEQTWVRLAARSVSRDLHVVVRSFAVGGSCVGDVLDTQLGDLLATRPDVAVIAVGSNDVLHWTPLPEVEAAFRLLVSTLSEQVPRVVLGGVGDLGAIARIPAPLSTVIGVRGRQIDRIIRRVSATRPNVRYVDVSSADGAFRAGGRHVFTPDLFHPNRYGHAIWAGVAGPVIASAIRSVPPRTTSPAPTLQETS
jgi:lysophospholipase L1-like esterase